MMSQACRFTEYLALFSEGTDGAFPIGHQCEQQPALGTCPTVTHKCQSMILGKWDFSLAAGRRDQLSLQGFPKATRNQWHPSEDSRRKLKAKNIKNKKQNLSVVLHSLPTVHLAGDKKQWRKQSKQEREGENSKTCRIGKWKETKPQTGGPSSYCEEAGERGRGWEVAGTPTLRIGSSCG